MWPGMCGSLWHAWPREGGPNKNQRRESIWKYRYRPGVATLAGKMYVLGGEEGWDRYHDTIECYDPATDSWSVVGDMPSSRFYLLVFSYFAISMSFLQVVVERCGLDHQERPGQGQVGLGKPSLKDHTRYPLMKNIGQLHAFVCTQSSFHCTLRIKLQCPPQVYTHCSLCLWSQWVCLFVLYTIGT